MYISHINKLKEISAFEAVQQKEKEQLEQIKELLNSWSGDPSNLQSAKSLLDEILTKNPKNAKALALLARYFLAEGYQKSRMVSLHGIKYQISDYDPGTVAKAKNTAIKATLTNPSETAGFIILGYIYIQMSDFESAKSALTQAERIGSADPWLDLNLADVYRMERNKEEVRTRCEKVYGSHTTNANAYIKSRECLLDIYGEDNNKEKVKELYEEIFKLEPKNAWVRGNYAAFLNKSGNFEEAIFYARQALSLMEYGIGRSTLAFALYNKWASDIVNSKKSEAEVQSIFDEAYSLHPDLDEVMAYEASLEHGKAIAQLLLHKGVSINAKVSDGSTALMFASYNGRNEVVEFLLSKKADPDLASDDGWTALLGAIDEGHQDTAKLLLKAGANPNLKVGDIGATDLAIGLGYTELADLIRYYQSAQKGAI